MVPMSFKLEISKLCDIPVTSKLKVAGHKINYAVCSKLNSTHWTVLPILVIRQETENVISNYLIYIIQHILLIASDSIINNIDKGHNKYFAKNTPLLWFSRYYYYSSSGVHLLRYFE